MSDYADDQYVSDFVFLGDSPNESLSDSDSWSKVDPSSDDETNNDEEVISSRSSSRSSRRSERSNSSENMALIRTGPTQMTTLPVRSGRPAQSQVTVQAPRTCPQRRSSPPHYSSRTPPTPDPRYWAPRAPVRQNQGHSYGAIFAAGNSKVLLGNVGTSNGRCHSYGPVFTAGQAKVYAGDVSVEEINRFFNRNR